MRDSVWDINLLLPFSRPIPALLSSHRHFLSLGGIYQARSEEIQEATLVLLAQIVPYCFGLLSSLQPDNRPVFVFKITQHLATSLDMKSSFHIHYRPQSSEKVEHASVLLRQYLTKLILELKLSLPVLPIALLHLRALSRKSLNFNPFKLHV